MGGAGLPNSNINSEKEAKSIVPGPRPRFRIWECVGAAMALLTAFHFLALRVRAGGLPTGDEGSWLSVAAELARGHGFSTRWLEAHFLLPYTLPRPDDFRYPALTSLLAVVFKVFGFSVAAGRWTVSVLFLTYMASLWLLCRATFGRWVGLATLCVASASLLQLEWNSAVYTEGLFGLIVVALAAWSRHGPNPSQTKTRRALWWAGLGAGVALLYLVRANGILFFPGIALLWWQFRKTERWQNLAWALLAFFVFAGPWMIRSLIYFGSPFHIAGNAGMFREAGQPHTYSIAEYFSQYEIFFPLQRMGLGFIRFFETLRFF